jgi:hypothetical protein
MFVAYVDESGHSSSTDFFSLAACVADWREWRQFNNRWMNALKVHSAPYLHMREFAHKVEAFAGWTEDRRRALMTDCLLALDSLGIITMGAVMRVSDYRRLSREAQVGFVDPTFCCFQDCLNGVALHGYLDFPGERTEVIYSRQDEFAPMLRKLFRYATEHWQDGGNLGVLEFQDMRTVPGLQLADLVAYELRHYYHLKHSRPELAIRVPFRRIIDHQQAQGAGMFRNLPAWFLQFQAAGVWKAAQAVIWGDPATWESLILEMVPEPLEFRSQIPKVAHGREVRVVDALRQRRLRDVRTARR